MIWLTDRPPGIAEGVEGRLRDRPYLALKNVSCAYRDGVLTLRGCLPSYYLKQVAQAAVAGMEGVARVVNAIEVTAPPGDGGGGRTQALTSPAPGGTSSE